VVAERFGAVVETPVGTVMVDDGDEDAAGAPPRLASVTQRTPAASTTLRPRAG
jgi:hypothetical protein